MYYDLVQIPCLVSFDLIKRIVFRVGHNLQLLTFGWPLAQGVVAGAGSKLAYLFSVSRAKDVFPVSGAFDSLAIWAG